MSLPIVQQHILAALKAITFAPTVINFIKKMLTSSVRKWITCCMTFQLTPTWYHFEAYRLLSPSQRLLHPFQRNYYWEMSIEHRVSITYILMQIAFSKVNNLSRDFSIDSSLILFWSLPSYSISTAFTPISTQLLSKNAPWTWHWNNIHTYIGFSGSK